MTDEKKIMIDDIDVSGCKFFNDITESYYCFGIPCKNRPNCYYKQLVRKTQEISSVHEYYEELRINATELADKNVKLKGELKEKEQECERKEKELLSNEKIINKLIKEVDELKQECDVLKSQLDFEVQQKECLEQECEELKEKLKFKVQENIKLSKENRNLKNWAHLKGVEIKVNRIIKKTNLEEFCRLFQFKKIQAREKEIIEWRDFETDLQWKFYENCKEWTSMRDDRDHCRKALAEIEDIADDYNRVGKTSQYYRDGFEEILDIINRAKGGTND